MARKKEIEDFGIKKYTKEQKKLHKDLQKLITGKYKDMGADDCMIVFGRVYSVYAMSYLKNQGALDFKK